MASGVCRLRTVVGASVRLDLRSSISWSCVSIRLQCFPKSRDSKYPTMNDHATCRTSRTWDKGNALMSLTHT